ncbi:MAG TPA: TlpA disulfide reductase family protein [Saprospiraceae bacterium]|nr:TlpA disulfide reductase family protein [Saprospiraceae bacterium]
MKNFKNVIFLILFSIGFITSIEAQKFMVHFDIKNYENDTLIVGNYFGEKQIVRDTLFAQGKGKFIWKEDEMPPVGVYLILFKPANTYAQFLVDGKEDKFSMSCNVSDLNNIKFKGSDENAIFYGYMGFLGEKRIQADTLRARIDRALIRKDVDKKSSDELENLDKEVKSHQKDILVKKPNSMTAMLIKSNIDVEVPEFEGNPDSVKYKRYYYYKKHYFDNIPMEHPALIRTPFIHPKIDYFVNKVSNQEPDSLIKTVDFVLQKLEPNPEAYRYYLADLLNKYAAMKLVGQDAIYVHLVDEYYKKGKASWINEENLQKMSDNADDLRPILIGKKIPDITTYQEDGTPVRLWDIQSPYTVVIFWAPDCGHCKKIMPDVVKFYDNNKSKGVKMLGICTKPGEKTPTCWPAIKEKGMTDFINTADEHGRFNSKIRVRATPKIFILDKDKNILIKDIPGEDLDRIFNEILTFEEKKRIAKE